MLDKLHAAYNFCVAHWAVISFVLAWVGTNIANALMARDPVDAGRIRNFVNWISLTTSAEFPAWKLKAPMSKGPEKLKPIAATLPPLPPAAVLLLAGVFLLSSCVGGKPKICITAPNSTSCHIAEAFLQCGPEAGIALLAAVPYIESANWVGLIAMLYQDFKSIAPCVEAAIAQTLPKVDADNLHAAHKAYRAAHAL